MVHLFMRLYAYANGKSAIVGNNFHPWVQGDKTHLVGYVREIVFPFLLRCFKHV